MAKLYTFGLLGIVAVVGIFAGAIIRACVG